MAATSFDAAAAVAALSSSNKPQDPAAAPSFVFDIYDDGASRPTTNNAQLVPHQPQQQQQQQRQPYQHTLPPSLPPSSPALPTGACNFVDLSHGSSGAQCGCRRFWSRSNSIAATPGTPSFGAFPAAGHIIGNQDGLDTASQAGWCMCSHHACFHDHGHNTGSMSDRVSINTSFFTTGIAPAGTSSSFLEKSSPPQLLLPLPPTPGTGQENEQAKPSRSPLSPVPYHQNGNQEATRNEPLLPDISFGFPSDAPVHLDTSFVAMINDAARESRDLIMASADVEVVEDEVPTEDEEASADVIAATPTPAAPPSVAVSIAGPPADHSIPDTLSWGPYGMSAHVDPSASAMGPISAPNAHPGPLPSQQPPPSTTASTSYTSQVRYMRPFAGKGLQTLTQGQPASAPVSSGSPLQALLEQDSNASASRHLGAASLARAVESHEVRLNKLENPSFCASSASVTASFVATQAHEECLERHDHMDMRVTDLESRIGEVERLQMNNDDAATVAASSVASVSAAGVPLSTSTSITGRTPRTVSAPDPAILSRMQALEEHISLLKQTALPSPSRPWQLEVVFLPFPLKGIWVEAVQFGLTDAVASAAAAQRRQSGSTPSYGDADGDDEWMQATQWADTPRLLPRACVPHRNIDRRLRSRGLVQAVTVRGADANSVHAAMVVAFGAMLRAMASNNTRAARGHRRSSSASLVSQFLGLQHSWVPLRKVHKESRLRLLKCSEMVTPAIWDVNFMTSSVVMKASGMHRLYVTQPGAYLQNREAYAHGWSWQKLKELPQVQVELENGTRGIDDECWAWDSKLDEPPVVSTSESASSSSSSPHLTASRMHRPSPSPFSRESTPTGRTRPHRASYPSMLATTTPAAVPAPAMPSGRSHSVSVGTSGLSEQFFTVAESPMQQRLHHQHLHQTAPGATMPTASITLRRSLSPFLSSTPSTRRVPLFIRTTSMPVPPQVGSPAMMRGSSSGAASRRWIHSAGSNHPAAAISAAPLSAGVNKRSRRRSTRSPSFGGQWTRNTPRYSRSPSATPGLGVNNAAQWATSEHQSRQHQHQRQTEPQRVRGTTPFAYATPFSTGADHFPPTSASSLDSGFGRRKRQRQERQDRQEQLQYRRNSRHGSRGPMPAVLGHANNGQNYYDDEDMMVVGYDSDDVDNFDYPMTQDDDDEDDDDDDADDIEVYEDEQDMLRLGNYNDKRQEEPGRQLLPKDQLLPGVEFDADENDEDDEDDDDDEDFIGHTFGAQHHQGSTQDAQNTQNTNDEDERMSDSENMDPSMSLFGDNNGKDEQPSQGPDQPGDDNKSDQSSQPSEYPSTRRPWRMGPVSAAVYHASAGHHQDEAEDRKHIVVDDTDIGFKIHEDGDAHL